MEDQYCLFKNMCIKICKWLHTSCGNICFFTFIFDLRDTFIQSNIKCET